MGVTPEQPFGSVLPFAEPSWYGALGKTNPYYTDSHRRLRHYCRQYVDSWIDEAGEWEAQGHVPSEQYQKHAQWGFVATLIQPISPVHLEKAGVTLPASIPVQEWDTFHSLIVADELMRCGYLGVVWALGGGNAIGGPPLVRFASPEVQDEILPAVLRGEKRVCLGVTEPQAGSDVAQLKTTAVLDGEDTYLVNGQKKWITNAVFADYVTAVVRTGEPDSGAAGISVLVIPLHLPGVERKSLANSGVNASGSTLITFDNVRVPVRYLLGKENEGFRIVMANFNGERLALAIQACRMSRVCIEDSYAYACKRVVFGKTLISQPVIRAKLADMGRAVERLQAWIEELANAAQHASSKQAADVELAGRVALLKVESGRCLELVNREAQQILGGLSFQRGGDHAGARIEQIGRDLRVMVVGGGSDEILTDLGTRMEKMKADSRL